jgi:GT2 family glycosyltransferase
MFVRREVFLKVGGFDPNLGMQGEKVAYGEEPAFQRKVRRQISNSKIYYDPQVFVYHLVRPEKINLQWMIHSSFSSGLDNFAVRTPQTRMNWWSLVKLTAKTVWGFCAHGIGIFARDRKRYLYWQTYFYFYELPIIADAGRAWALFQILTGWKV